MGRITICLTDRQEQELDKICEKTSLTRSAILRRGLTIMINQSKQENSQKNEDFPPLDLFPSHK